MRTASENRIKITDADLERILREVRKSMAPSLAEHIGAILTRLSREVGDSATMAACANPVPTDDDRNFMNGFRAALQVVATTGKSLSKGHGSIGPLGAV